MSTNSGLDNPADRIAEAVGQFNRSQNREDGVRVVGCLVGTLTILRESLYLRIHHDVEQVMGVDSMLMPVSEVQARRRTAEEIEAFQVAESAVAAAQGGYVDAAEQWYLPWLARLRCGQLGMEPKILPRSREYFSDSSDNRRLAFADTLARILAESRQAPLVLFRLMPPAVQIATALAFGDHATASRLREQQKAVLPAIGDCRECHGQVLPCAEQCRECGNPLWKHEWLVATD